MERKTIGAFISALRKAKGMTQAELADSLGISNKAISRWEREECLPDVSLIPVIAEVFDVTCDELLKGERITRDNAEVSTAKVDKQRKYMLSKATSNYKYMTYIAIAVSLVGFILLFAIAYGFFKTILGFCVMLVLVIGSVTLSLIARAKLNDKLNGNEVLCDMVEQDRKGISMLKYKYTFASIFISSMIVIMGLPLVIFRSEYVESVLSFVDYIKMLPFIILLGMLAWLIFGVAFQNKFSPKERDKKLRKCLLWLLIFQLGGSLIIGSLCSLPLIINGNAEAGYIALAVTIPITMLAPIIILSVRNREYSRAIITTGVLYIGIIVACVVLLGAFGSYKSYDGEGNLTGSGMLYAEGSIFGSVAALAVTLIIYALLKKFWVQNK